MAWCKWNQDAGSHDAELCYGITYIMLTKLDMELHIYLASNKLAPRVIRIPCSTTQLNVICKTKINRSYQTRLVHYFNIMCYLKSQYGNNNHTPSELWDEITYPFTDFNGYLFKYSNVENYLSFIAKQYICLSSTLIIIRWHIGLNCSFVRVFSENIHIIYITKLYIFGT